VRSDASGASIHVADWHITALRRDGSAQPLPVPARFAALPAAVPPGPPRNVGLLYRELARAIAEDRQPEPGFATAVGYHRLVDAIERASKTGVRQDVTS
jgi:predicted dehydrogenase